MAIITVASGTTDLTATLAALTTGDELWFLEGSQSITAGLDLSSVALNRVYFGPNFRGTISGTSLTVRVDNGSGPKIDIASSSPILRLASGTGVTTININPEAGEVRLTSGTFTNVHAKRGDVYIDGSAVATTVYNQGTTLTIADNATAITTLQALAGETRCTRDITTANVDATARVYLNTPCTVTTLNGAGDGVVYHRSYVLSGGAAVATIGTMNAAGKFTYTLQGAIADTKITTLNINSARARIEGRRGQTVAAIGTTNDNAGAGTVTVFDPALPPD